MAIEAAPEPLSALAEALALRTKSSSEISLSSSPAKGSTEPVVGNRTHAADEADELNAAPVETAWLEALAAALEADATAESTRLERDEVALARDDETLAAAPEAEEWADEAAEVAPDDADEAAPAPDEAAPPERHESDVPAATVVGELLPTAPLLSVM